MTIEISLLISGISMAFAIFAGIMSLRRNSRKDTEQAASQITTVIVKLENIGSNISEIKNDISAMKSDVKSLTERIIAVELSLKAAWRWIDEFKEVKR